MLVSIIIPVYNVKPYLKEALESIINQTYKNIEIIIINDGSTDGSEKLCNEYAKNDKRIKLIHQNNIGLSGTRNKGLDLAKGEAIAFLDSDDIYHPEYIRKMVSYMACGSCDVVICKYKICNENGKTQWWRSISPQMKQGKYDRISSLRALVEGKIDHHVWNKLYRRRHWEKIRFPIGHVYEDIDVMFRIIDSCNMIGVLDMPLYVHRNHPKSIVNTNSKENIEDLLLAFSHFALYVEDNTPEIFTQKHVDRILRSEYYQIIYSYICYSQGGEVIDEFSKKLKEKIICREKTIEISDAALRIKIGYYLLCYCPFLLKIAYSIYRRLW